MSSNFTWFKWEYFLWEGNVKVTKRNGYYVCKWKYKGNKYKVYFGYGVDFYIYKKYRIVNAYHPSPSYFDWKSKRQATRSTLTVPRLKAVAVVLWLLTSVSRVGSLTSVGRAFDIRKFFSVAMSMLSPSVISPILSVKDLSLLSSAPSLLRLAIKAGVGLQYAKIQKPRL